MSQIDVFSDDAADGLEVDYDVVPQEDEGEAQDWSLSASFYVHTLLLYDTIALLPQSSNGVAAALDQPFNSLSNPTE